MKAFTFCQSKDPILEARKRLKDHMESVEVDFLVSLDRQLQQRKRALRWGDAEGVIERDRSLRELMECYDQWKHDAWVQSVIADMLPPELKATKPVVIFKYMSDSLFLRDCYHYLMQAGIRGKRGRFADEPEWACAVTGPRLGEVRVLDRLVMVKIAYQSAGGIRLSTDGLQEALIGLQEEGHSLHGIFHSHRMHGPGGAHPSHTDLDTQEHILEAAYPAIQGIFTEDGYIRFFSFKRPFDVDIYGKGVEHVDHNLFKLQRIGAHAPAVFGTPFSPA